MPFNPKFSLLGICSRDLNIQAYRPIKLCMQSFIVTIYFFFFFIYDDAQKLSLALHLRFQRLNPGWQGKHSTGCAITLGRFLQQGKACCGMVAKGYLSGRSSFLASMRLCIQSPKYHPLD